MDASTRSLVLLAVISASAPLLARLTARRVAVPLVVFEIVLGILLGPQVLGWIKDVPDIDFLSSLGLAMLFLLAGYEIDFARVQGRPLQRSITGWLISLVVGVTLGVLLAPSTAAGVMIGICLTSTALGTIMPVLRDAHELETPFGTSVLAIGTVGEFGPLVAVALFLSGRSPARAAVILIAFALLIVIALVVAVKVEHRRLHRAIEATLHTSGQFAVRLVILILAALVGLATAFGEDMLLGAFAAGVLIKILLGDGDPAAVTIIEAKLDAIGFGFLVPAFFITTGVTFDLDALFDDTASLLLVPTLLVLFVVIRGIPATICAPPGIDARSRAALALFGATGLPIIVAVTAIGLDHGELKTSTAAALVGAGMLSVLIFPMLGLSIKRPARGAAPATTPSTAET